MKKRKIIAHEIGECGQPGLGLFIHPRCKAAAKRRWKEKFFDKVFPGTWIYHTNHSPPLAVEKCWVCGQKFAQYRKEPTCTS